MRQAYIIIAIILCTVCGKSTSAQQQTVKFTGRDRTNQYRIKLDRVEIFNLDQLWEEVLYYPDTTLLLGTVGIEDHELNSGLQLMQNVPNPFNGATEFALTMPETGDVQLEIYDITGKLVEGKRFSNLEAGTHLFRAILSSPQTYLLSAKANDSHITIKMVNEGYAAENSIQHLGMTNADGDFTLYLDDDKFSSDYPFNVGDEMKYIGYALIDGVMQESSIHIGRQTNSETIPLQFDVTVPTVAITSVGGVTGTSASIVCNVSASGGSSVSKRGVCWSTSQNPTVGNSHTTDGSGTGSFTSNITGLSVGTTYYVRAYATNGVGTVYGTQRSIRTASLPTVTTRAVTNITGVSAVCGGDVTSDGGSSVTARGVCWSTSSSPTISDNHTVDGGGTGVFTGNLTGLATNTTYYVRAYATNSAGTVYGNLRSFFTSPLPTVITNTVSNVTSVSAVCVGNVTSSGGTPVIARGFCWSTTQNPTISNSHTTNGGGTGSFTSNITGLTAGTTYYVRAYATNSAGTAYGAQQGFTTSISVPTVTTNTVGNIASTSATCGGVVTSAGGAAVTARGVCWSTSQNPTISSNHTTNGNGTGSFTSSMTGLTAGTTYYVRAYATNSAGTAYGTQQIFYSQNAACPNASTITDNDGNVYNTVQIGSQCWMKENLRTTHFRDGTSMTLATSDNTGDYYYPNNSHNNVATYGLLYRWYAVMNNSTSGSTNPRGICPEGWHIPSSAEWIQLKDYLSGLNSVHCGNSSLNIAKALATTSGWLADTNTCVVGNDASSNNCTGFSAKPAGYSIDAVLTSYLGYSANFWSSTATTINGSSSGAYAYIIEYDDSKLSGVAKYKVNFYSVRCLKN